MDEKVTKINLMRNWLSDHLYDMAAYAGLIICIIMFILNNDKKLVYNLGVVIQTAAPYAIISLGAVFVYSMGFMDVSVGQQVGVYCIIIILISNALGGTLTGVAVGFFTIVAIALLCGAINGAVAVWLKLPSIVTSLFLMFVLGGIQYLLMEHTGSNSISLAVSIKPSDRNTYNLILIIIIVIVAILVNYFFNYSKLGKYVRGIGANETATSQAGVNVLKWKVIAYMAFGLCVAIGTFILLSRTGSAGKGTGGGYAMDIMICLILGGMPLSGGMKSKVRSALIGTFTYVLISNNLTTMGVNIYYLNLVKAVIFIIIILITCRKKDGVLPR